MQLESLFQLDFNLRRGKVISLKVAFRNTLLSIKILIA